MKKILIIEDEAKLLATLVYLISFAGYQVEQAKDGLEGLEKVHREKPDIILCDIMMPKLDGYGFLIQHSLSSYSYIPVILMSAKSGSDDELEGLSLGAKAYVRKPFHFQDLDAILKRYLLLE